MLFRYYGIGNVGSDAIDTFKETHKCGNICKSLNLLPVVQNSMYIYNCFYTKDLV
jgi:hypothetical protein